MHFKYTPHLFISRTLLNGLQLLVISLLKNALIIQQGTVQKVIFSLGSTEIEQLHYHKVTLSLKLITSTADLLVYSFKLLYYLSRMGGKKFRSLMLLSEEQSKAIHLLECLISFIPSMHKDTEWESLARWDTYERWNDRLYLKRQSNQHLRRIHTKKVVILLSRIRSKTT